ncbi:MAG: nicotinate-nucleotide adenylyltransferase [Firmicutes bacterium]|nr:nicotinate-nucleotide adenylyltransferase [Bacillota bacterium]
MEQLLSTRAGSGDRPRFARRRIGIMGGTFDPIHYGHLVAANTARFEFGMEAVILVPSGRPPHKEERVISDPEHRYRMALLATFSNPHFLVSRFEIDREGYSYTIDTVKHFKEIFGSEVALFFITGADAVLEIMTWKNVHELVTYCSFVAVSRPGFNLMHLNSNSEIDEKLLARTRLLEIPALAISSTDIRNRVAQNRPIQYLLPEKVEEYTRAFGVYK